MEIDAMETSSVQIDAVHGWTSNPDPEEALDGIFGDRGTEGASLGIVFVTPDHDLDRVGRLLDERFDCPVLACTTAGEIGEYGYVVRGISAAALWGVEARVGVIRDAEGFGDAEAEALVAQLGAGSIECTDSSVLLTIFDGLSMREEWMCSSLYRATGGVPMVGGSSGDGLTFDRAMVYVDGRFERGVSTCALVHAESGIRTFVDHHFEDTGTVLVVTGTDPSTRRILEINGVPAADAYARALGHGVGELTEGLTLKHPLMVRAGDRLYVRGVRALPGDGSLAMYCSIEEGAVLHVGRPGVMEDHLESLLARTTAGIDPKLVMMFDCVLRRCEADRFGKFGPMGRCLSGYPVHGFSTYGEQFNGVHVNQTVTGVVFGVES